MVLNGIKEAHNGVTVGVGGKSLHIHDGDNSKKVKMLADILGKRMPEQRLLKYLGNVT